jgi:hypothetical protein
MTISPINLDATTLAASSRNSSGMLDRQRSFLESMGRHGIAPVAGGESAPSEGDADDKARRAAEQFVSTTFILPILKELRAQNRAAPPFGPTQAEKTLGPMMDAQLADRMVRSGQFALVDRVAAELRGVERRESEPGA